ncbi:MAG: hypothetical protein C5B51_14810 [Terriglobia bacterium]|nr:MAG: hypothetical protein C5B51_14810 [Terriglobia bacterium]
MLQKRTVAARGENPFPEDHDILQETRIIKEQRIGFEHLDGQLHKIGNPLPHQKAFWLVGDFVDEFDSGGHRHDAVNLETPPNCRRDLFVNQPSYDWRLRSRPQDFRVHASCLPRVSDLRVQRSQCLTFSCPFAHAPAD